MNCKFCGKKIARDWSYCPYCGERIERDDFFSAFNKFVNDVFSNFFGKPKFTIKIKTSNQGRQAVKTKPLRMPEELIEPEARIRRLGSVLEVIMELPGVKSLSDVSVTVMSESLEVKAVAGAKGYFKVVSIPRGYELIDKSIHNSVLSLKLREAYEG